MAERRADHRAERPAREEAPNPAENLAPDAQSAVFLLPAGADLARRARRLQAMRRAEGVRQARGGTLTEPPPRPQNRSSFRDEGAGHGGLAVLDRPRRHLHRHRRARSRRPPVHREAAVGEPGTLPRRGGGRHPPGAAPGPRGADPARGDRGGEDGHHGGHQRAARTQGRTGAAAGQSGLRGHAPHRQPGPPAAVRPAGEAARPAA